MELDDPVFNPVTVVAKLRALPTLAPALVVDLTPRIIMKPKITLTELLDVLAQCGAAAEDVFVLRAALETPAITVAPQVAAPLDTECRSAQAAAAPGSPASSVPIIPFEDLKDQAVLAHGAFGEVRSAKRSGFGLVVMKTHRMGSYNRESISKELGLLRSISPHTHVARVLGVCIDSPDGALAIIMDYCPHGSLASFLHTLPKPLDEGLVLNILRQCADGLQHIHASKLVHRDVRADNFLVASRDPLRMIITDFGLSHKLHDIDGAWRSFSETLVGPVAWRAPETFNIQQGKQELSFKTDVFMFGCVMLEVMTCQPPFWWLPSAEAVITYKARLPLQSNPIDAAVAEDKLVFAMSDSPTRASLVELARWCTDTEPLDRPTVVEIMNTLESIMYQRTQPVHNDGAVAYEAAMESAQAAPSTLDAVKEAALVASPLRSPPTASADFVPLDTLITLLRQLGLAAFENKVVEFFILNDMEGAERGAIAKLLIQATVPGTIAMQVKAALYTTPLSQVGAKHQVYDTSQQMVTESAALEADLHECVSIGNLTTVAGSTEASRLISILESRGGVSFAPLALRDAVCSALAQLCERSSENRITFGATGVAAVIDVLRHSADNIAVCISALRALRWLAGGETVAEKCEPNIAAALSSDGIIFVVSSLQKHADDAGVCEWACRVLFALARTVEGAQTIVSSGGLFRLYAAMSTHAHVSAIQQHACWALSNLSAVNQNKVSLIASGCVDRVCAAALAHKADPYVQHSACMVLSNLATCSEHHSQFLTSGGLQCILLSMSTHSTSSDIQRIGCLALSRLVANPASRQVVVTDGGLLTMLRTMSAFMEVDSIQEYGCCALVNLAASPDTRRAVASARGLLHLCDAMRSHPLHPDIQRYGCWALSNFSSDDTLAGIAAAAGGLDCVTAALATLCTDVGVLMHGMVYLMNHVANPANHASFMYACGLNIIMSTMVDNMSVADLQHHCCRSLASLAVSTDIAARIVSAKGISAICNSMAAHDAVPEVQQYGCWALANIANDSPAHQAAVLREGGLERIMAAMSAHPQETDVQKHACWALANLVFDNPDHKVRVAAEGGIELVLQAMTQHALVPDVQIEACRVLATLVKEESIARTSLRHPVIETLLATMTTHMSVSLIQEKGVLSLSRLAVVPANQARIISAGGLERIFAAMSMHVDTADIQHFGSWAVANLATTSEQCLRIVSSGGLERVFVAMSAHAGVAAVQELGCFALYNLSLDSTSVAVMRASKRAVELLSAALIAHVGSSEVVEWATKALTQVSASPKHAHEHSYD